MSKLQNEIGVSYTDPEINQLIRDSSTESSSLTRHFNHNEEFFLTLKDSFAVPSFPIHHDVQNPIPTQKYLDSLRLLLSRIVALAPHIFHGLTYFFEPSDIFRPGFFQLFRLADFHYLYLLKLGLSFKTNEHELEKKGTNDITAEYRSKKLFLEGTLIPLEAVNVIDKKITGFKVKQTINETWLGETGKGYFAQGIWIDHELTKFFTKLFLPKGKRAYPYYPFQCKYRTMCQGIIDLGFEERKKSAPYLHRALKTVSPMMRVIHASLKNSDFSEELATFKAIKQRIPSFWDTVWNDLVISPYLNEHDMKEFIIENHA